MPASTRHLCATRASGLLVLQTETEQIPCKDKPAEGNASERDYGLAQLAPKPALACAPGAEHIVHSDHGSENAEPAGDLDATQQRVVARAEDADIFQSCDKEREESQHENEIQ